MPVMLASMSTMSNSRAGNLLLDEFEADRDRPGDQQRNPGRGRLGRYAHHGEERGVNHLVVTAFHNLGALAEGKGQCKARERNPAHQEHPRPAPPPLPHRPLPGLAADDFLHPHQPRLVAALGFGQLQVDELHRLLDVRYQDVLERIDAAAGPSPSRRPAVRGSSPSRPESAAGRAGRRVPPARNPAHRKWWRIRSSAVLPEISLWNTGTFTFMMFLVVTFTDTFLDGSITASSSASVP